VLQRGVCVAVRGSSQTKLSSIHLFIVATSKRAFSKVCCALQRVAVCCDLLQYDYSSAVAFFFFLGGNSNLMPAFAFKNFRKPFTVRSPEGV